MLEETTYGRKKVLCPVERKDGKKTTWRPMGHAYVNKDNSINVYLDTLPLNGKLHIRDWDDREETAPRRADGAGQFSLRSVPAVPPDGSVPPSGPGDELPF